MSRRFLLLLLSALLCLKAGAVEPPSREQALHDLASPQLPLRHAAIVRLADVGRMSDAALILPSLKDADSDMREAAELALWSIWSRSGDAKVDALLAQGTVAMNSGLFDEALESFNAVVRRKPDFAEGWNKRATLYFLAGDARKSMADCREALKRNPQHFGALSGYGQLYMQMDEPEKALQYFEKAYAINPGMKGVAINIRGLKHLLDQRHMRST
jgi:tetratricopeptide (TPR) repeat protein